MMLALSLTGIALAALAVVRIFVMPWLVMGPQALDQFRARSEYRAAAMGLVTACAALIALPLWMPEPLASHDMTFGWSVRV
jgi:hypothetical protein